MKDYFFDIETEGFCAYDDAFILADFYYLKKDKHVHKTVYSLQELSNFLTKEKEHNMVRLIGKNTDNYRGGFDIPFLRTKYMMLNASWPFKGVENLDIGPLIKSLLQTKTYEIKTPSKSSLNKPDLEKICEANGYDYVNKKETYRAIMEDYEGGKDIDWCGYEKIKCPSRNDLQTIYQKIYDPEINEEYIDGAEVPVLFMEGKIDLIEKHCKKDNERTKKIFDDFNSMIPAYYISKNSVTL